MMQTPRIIRALRLALSAAAGIALVTACAVGPDYNRPTFDAAPNYKEPNGLEAQRAQ